MRSDPHPAQGMRVFFYACLFVMDMNLTMHLVVI